MPIRFPTEAANDPGMKPGAPQGTPPDLGADGTPRGRADGTPEPRERGKGESKSGHAKPGEDINQAGFVRERDREPDRDR